MNLKNITTEIDKHKDFATFIKTTSDTSTLSTRDKVALNRKGNELFNNGDVEKARKIFFATGYSDGLTRVGKNYEENKRPLDALKQYILAHNEKRTEDLCEKFATVISNALKA